MTRRKIVVIDPFSPDLSAIKRGLAECGDYALETPAEGRDWRETARDAHGVIVNLTPIDAEAVGGLENCEVIARLGAGYDNVDIQAARRKGISVTNVADYCGDEVSEHVLALMLSWLRYIPQADADMKNGLWKQTGYRPIRRLNTRTLGLVGYGRLARAVAQRALALGMGVVAHDPHPPPGARPEVEMLELDALLERLDIVSLHTPLLPATRGMIDREALDRMKSGALLINAARGGLIDERALVEAVEAGRIGGAALDVFATEPLEAESPLRGHPRILLTPHMAFYSEDSLASLQEQAARAVADILSGKGSANVVN